MSHAIVEGEARFLPEVEEALRSAGWFPGRALTDTQMLPWFAIDWRTEKRWIQTRIFPTAYRILREFGGLSFPQEGPGITCYRTPFAIDPLLWGEKGWRDSWFIDEWCADGALFPLGMGTNVFLAVTGQGKVISNNDDLIGNSIEEALTNLILGIMPVQNEVDQDTFLEASRLLPLVMDEFGE